MDKQEEKEIFKQIKKQNGERFANVLRAIHVLSIPGIVQTVKYAGRDATPLKKYLISLKNIHVKFQDVTQDPIDLLNQAGYDAYLVTAQNDTSNPNFDPKNPKTWVGQDTIEPYFYDKERICTLGTERWREKYIIVCIKRGADTLKREDFFGIEEREDPYGSSVITIQMDKNVGDLFITCRYNHTVEFPDETFHANPDEIIPGLSGALCKRFMIDFPSKKCTLPNGFIMLGGQIIRYHKKVGFSYFGPSYYIKNEIIHHINTDKEIILEQFIFNLKEKTFKTVTAGERSQLTLLEQELEGKTIQIHKGENGIRHLIANGQEIMTLQDGNLIHLTLTHPRETLEKASLQDFSHLETVTLSPGLKNIEGWVFYGCNRLKEIILPAEMTEIREGTFASCATLKHILLPQSITKIGNWAFSKCFSLEEIILPKGITTIGCMAFEGCCSLTSITIPEGVTEINTSTFHGCLGLKNITLPKSLTKIDNEAFIWCKLKNVVLPEKVNYIGNYAFQGCSALESINLPNNITYIGEGAFAGCTALKEITLPMNLQHLEENAFLFCKDLTITCRPDQVKMLKKSKFTGNINVLPVQVSTQSQGSSPSNLLDI